MNNAQMIKDVIRTLNCMSPMDFWECFGTSMGNHFLNKFKGLECDSGSFICTLDDNYVDSLILFTIKRKGL